MPMEIFQPGKFLLSRQRLSSQALTTMKNGLTNSDGCILIGPKGIQRDALDFGADHDRHADEQHRAKQRDQREILI